MNIKDLKIYKNNKEDISQLEIGEIYALLYDDDNITNTNVEEFDTEVILKIREVDLVHRHIYFDVILSRYIIPENSSDEEVEKIISNWETNCESRWQLISRDPEHGWNINQDGSVFIKFDEYQDYLNNKNNQTICPHHEEEEING